MASKLRRFAEGVLEGLREPHAAETRPHNSYLVDGVQAIELLAFEGTLTKRLPCERHHDEYLDAWLLNEPVKVHDYFRWGCEACLENEVGTERYTDYQVRLADGRRVPAPPGIIAAANAQEEEDRG